MSKTSKPFEINIFSPLGIAIASIIFVPILAFVGVTSYRSSFTDTIKSSASGSEAETEKIDVFFDAVNRATNAANLTQIAHSSDEWYQVAVEWQAAITLMQSVSASNSNYEVAKQKAEEYQSNLSYAQQNVERLQKEQEKAKQAQIARGESIFTNLGGIYQTAGEATATPVVRIIIPQAGWNQLSKADQISLTLYAENLVTFVKSNPSQYVTIPLSSPIYSTFLSNIANLCQDCWSIVLSYKNTQPYTIDQTIVQGDTPWTYSDACCRGTNSSDFRR